jgi:MerR family transcriptional regulator, thiopeptide resistance regulator
MKPGTYTISALAKSAGLSRSALLYYHRLGLLKPGRRNRAGYRIYTVEDSNRLEQVCMYRQLGIPLREIRRLLDECGETMAVEILQHRLHLLNGEIANLRRQQRCIVELLKQEPLIRGMEMITKNRWVEIMRAAGLNDSDMSNWHTQFEKMEPEAHQEFLESLGIEPAEIKKIREWSAAG